MSEKIYKKLYDLLQHKSKGMIRLDKTTSQQIIDIVVENGNTAIAKFYRHDGKGWIFIRQVPTTDEMVSQRIAETLTTKPIENCYKFECFNSNGLLEGQIFTMNADLF